MRFYALVTDFDGTLALDGRVTAETTESLKALLKTGRRVVLVTGRLLDDLRCVYEHLELFAGVVAENGALLFDPSTGTRTPLAPPAPPEFIAALSEKGVRPLEYGHSIVATWQPHETTVLETIREFGLDLAVIFNKGAVMVLPSGVNKASGLKAQLERLGISAHSVVGVGDAENDLAFLEICEASAAVANALPRVRERCDIALQRDHGEGVRELIDALIAERLPSASVDRRHRIVVGTGESGQPVCIPPYCRRILVAGMSGGGKSTLTAGIIERLGEQGYQWCVIDPEGDYESVPDGVMLGDDKNTPGTEQMLTVLEKGGNCVANLLAVPIDRRPAFSRSLFAALFELRSSTGRPHWLILDEAHHILPSGHEAFTLPSSFANVMLVTTSPSLLQREALSEVEIVVSMGRESVTTMQESIAAIAPDSVVSLPQDDSGEAALIWQRGDAEATPFTVAASSWQRLRHRRKYAVGQLSDDKSFYFTGADRRLNLRARNLVSFVDLARGVDDDTWLYHLGERAYSRWIREAVGDEMLAATVEAVENQTAALPGETRERVASAILERYTAPA